MTERISPLDPIATRFDEPEPKPTPDATRVETYPQVTVVRLNIEPHSTTATVPSDIQPGDAPPIPDRA
jgi:hypothetical protein